MDTQTAPQKPFGSVLTEVMSVTWFRDGRWEPQQIVPTAALPVHPAAHTLHYGSSCFEGFKAYRRADGGVHIFRLDKHIERMRQSARALVLPEPDREQLSGMVRALVDRCRDEVPEAPGALYLRPLLFGTMANIGAAGTPSNEACLVVLASPVWDYFAGGMKALRIAVELNYRTAPHLGMTLAAKAASGADQVLFCPGGQVQETGAANFLLIRDGAVLTRSLDSSFLHGVTRDSLLVLARDLGYSVSERIFDVQEMLRWVTDGEAALSGTAAVLAGVGTLIHEGREHRVGNGEVGPHTRALRAALIAIQRGEAPDHFGWLTPV
jgi:branched-chain amino acid aminotransferase